MSESVWLRSYDYAGDAAIHYAVTQADMVTGEKKSKNELFGALGDLSTYFFFYLYFQKYYSWYNSYVIVRVCTWLGNYFKM